MSDYTEKFDKMRVAGKLAAQTLDMLTDNIKEGISTDYIDKLGYEFIRDNGGYSAPQFYRGFKKSLCTSLNHVVCHGIPGDRILRDGDAINVDVTAIINDHYGDMNNFYSLYLMKNYIKNDFVLINSDLVFDKNIFDIFVKNVGGKYSTFMIDEGKILGHEEMKVNYSENSLITQFGKYLSPENANGEYIGLCYLKFEFFDGIHRFIPSLFEGYGYPVKYIPVNHRKRIHGTSKYNNLSRLFKTIPDMLKVKKMIKQNNKK